MNKQLEHSFAGRWIRAIARNLRKIVLLCLAVAIASSVYALTRKQVWTAYAVAAVPGGQQLPMSGLSALGGVAGDLLGTDLAGISGMMNMNGTGALDMNLVLQVLASRTVFERVIFKYDLLADMNVPTMDDALTEFNSRASISLTDEGFFVVSMEADSRERSAAMVNDIIQFANQELATIITSRARRSRIAAEELLAAAQESLGMAQGRMEDFREETGLLFPEEQGISTVQLLAALETDLILAEAELAGVSGSLSSSSPAYSEIARKVEYLRSAISSKASEDSLGYLPGMENMPALMREYENIAIDLETRRAIYLMLRQELESLKLEEVKDSPSIEVLVPAVPTALRSSPKRGKMVISYTAAAFLLSLLWMAVITYIRQILDDDSTGPYWRNVLRTAGRQLLLVRKNEEGSSGRT